MKSLLITEILSIGIIYSCGPFCLLCINDEVNLINISLKEWSFIFSIKSVLIIFFIFSKEVKNKLFNGLADWIIDREPNYPSFGEFKLWIKKKISKYIIYKNHDKEILMLLTYFPMTQHINNVLHAKYLAQTIT